MKNGGEGKGGGALINFPPLKKGCLLGGGALNRGFTVFKVRKNFIEA